MRVILFCANPYAFGILKPLYDELIVRHHDVLWYVPEKIEGQFPFTGIFKKAKSIKELYAFKSDCIFVPGNEVPHYLQGVKVQVFHGLAGEKQGHFRIRNYFDLYLTQGPYFTRQFEILGKKYRDFTVKETGWCKLDPLYQKHEEYLKEKQDILVTSNKKKLVLYAPTFSPSLTSASASIKEIFNLADTEDIYLLIKFHDLMDARAIDEYKALALSRTNVTIVEDRNILKYLILSDIMISDTSSVVYEFILLNKPVITIRSSSENISWCDISEAKDLREAFRKEITEDRYKGSRISTIREYHPYTDGRSSTRMIAAVEDYIKINGVPEERRINIYRRYKMNKMFGNKPN